MDEIEKAFFFFFQPIFEQLKQNWANLLTYNTPYRFWWRKSNIYGYFIAKNLKISRRWFFVNSSFFLVKFVSHLLTLNAVGSLLFDKSCLTFHCNVNSFFIGLSASQSKHWNSEFYNFLKAKIILLAYEK